ncbi:MAG TPA: NifU family protein [Acidimicrobiales bacterium]|nr:NifU family protein [Acidimicrobiales bacterium]
MSVFSNEQYEASAVLHVTPAATDLIVSARASEEHAGSLALFVEVNGERDGAYTYDMWFAAISDASAQDAVVEVGDLSVVVITQSISSIRGATLDVGADGLVMLNPNRPSLQSTFRPPPVSDLSSSIEIAVLQILEQEINPQIAAHGGHVDLVAVEEGTAFLRLSGGCQGCGMAAVTLSQGISVAIREAFPEIVEIVDVTAHEDGANPYFEAAKK